MKSNWTIKTLTEVCTKIGSGQTPRGGKESYKGGRFALVRSQNVYNEGFTENGLVYINDSQAHQLSNVEILSNDVLINITGDSVTRCCMVPDEILPARVNQHVSILRADNQFLDSGFLRYFLISPSVQKKLLTLSSGGATRKALTKAMLESFEIVLPTLSEQKAISTTLGILDEKIKLNQKSNKTLEAITKSLFKSWFIDFDPVKAKIEDLATGLPDEISDLFPNALVDSELGKIPKDWSIFKLKDFISLDSGLPYKGKLKGEGEGYILTMGCADKSLRFKSQGVYKYPSNIPEKHLVRPGDIVVCSHDLTQARDQLGQPFIVPEIYEKKSTAAATNTFIVRSKKNYNSEFLYQFFRTRSFRNQMIASAKGSVILHISKDSILDHNLATPSTEKIFRAYQQITLPFISKLNENEKNNQILVSIRNNLLPKLISGELRISDAETMLEEVGI